jgi:catalase
VPKERLYRITFAGVNEMTTASQITSDKQKIYEEIIDVLATIFGKHAGARAVHAKGAVYNGSFVAEPEAAKFCRAPHLKGASIPCTLRLSDFAGIPNLPDADPNASPRGFAVRFETADGETDIVAHSYNGFPVATIEEFLAFAKALASNTIEAFAKEHAATALFATTPKPTPASFANETFYGVNAFRFFNASGEMKHGRYQIIPVAGDKRLTKEEADAKPPNFLFEEVAERLAKGPVEYKLLVQVADPTDNVNDATSIWPESRTKIELGKISITSVDQNSQTAEKKLIFDPQHLIDGIEISDDPLIPARSAVYSVSYARRNPS